MTKKFRLEMSGGELGLEMIGGFGLEMSGR